MKRPLQAGDRCAVYWSGYERTPSMSGGSLYAKVYRGVARIGSIDGQLVRLRGLTWEGSQVGPEYVLISQCRRLIPKKPRRVVFVRQELYETYPGMTPLISYPGQEVLTLSSHGDAQPPGDWVRFIEVRPKKARASE